MLWASVDTATPEMGEMSVGVGSCNMFAFLKVNYSCKKKKELVRAKESRVLEIKLQIRNTLRNLWTSLAFFIRESMKRQ